MQKKHEPREYARNLGLDPDKLPKHVAVIMDGNGRWAADQGKPRAEGHLRGATTVRQITEECCKLGINQLTLYCLSHENWKRPQAEIDFLMALFKDYLIGERDLIQNENIRMAIIGRRIGIPEDVQTEMDHSLKLSEKNTGLTLCLAVNYGSRQEILDAVKSISENVKKGECQPSQITEATIAEHLYTAGMPDPDLLIRTSGEMRISNYLLWQISYSELWITDLHWPDFTPQTLHEACRSFAQRSRRFGGLESVSGAI
jgi:undecaprenyl diphosphate synthase